jgi:hypothetical protein
MGRLLERRIKLPQTEEMLMAGRIPTQTARDWDLLLEAGRDQECEVQRASEMTWLLHLPSWESRLMPLPSRFDLGAGLSDRIELRRSASEIRYRWIYWSRHQTLLHAIGSAMVAISEADQKPAMIAIVNLVIFASSFAIVQHSWAKVLARFENKLGTRLSS